MTAYYEDEHVTLYHGDCREEPRWIQCDVLVTDPPYGIAARLEYARGGRSGKSSWAYQQIAGDNDTAARDAALVAWGTRPALVFGSWKRTPPTRTRMTLVWDKGEGAGMGDLSLPWKPNWEEVYVLGTGFSGFRSSGVLSGYPAVSWSSKGREHPHMKPVPLMLALIDKCPPGVIADPFAGSGSTLVAAKQLGRSAIGVEVDESYCEVTAKRLSQGVLDFDGAAS